MAFAFPGTVSARVLRLAGTRQRETEPDERLRVKPRHRTGLKVSNLERVGEDVPERLQPLQSIAHAVRSCIQGIPLSAPVRHRIN
jgi:hypothetical protein